MSTQREAAANHLHRVREDVELAKEITASPLRCLFDGELMWEELQEELNDAEAWAHDTRFDPNEKSEAYLVIGPARDDKADYYGYGAGLCTRCGHPIPLNFYSDEGPFCSDCDQEARAERHEKQDAGLRFAWECDLIQRTNG